MCKGCFFIHLYKMIKYISGIGRELNPDYTPLFSSQIHPSGLSILSYKPPHRCATRILGFISQGNRIRYRPFYNTRGATKRTGHYYTELKSWYCSDVGVHKIITFSMMIKVLKYRQGRMNIPNNFNFKAHPPPKNYTYIFC